MKLWPSPFNNIKNNTKTVELRLNDEKRRQIKVNDFISFTNVETDEKILVKVNKISKFKNFEDLYNNYNKIELGYKEDEIANPSDMLNYYSKKDIKKYGVLAIEISNE